MIMSVLTSSGGDNVSMKLTSSGDDKVDLKLTHLLMIMPVLPLLVMIMRSSGLAEETALWKLSSLLMGSRSP